MDAYNATEHRAMMRRQMGVPWFFPKRNAPVNLPELAEDVHRQFSAHMPHSNTQAEARVLARLDALAWQKTKQVLGKHGRRALIGCLLVGMLLLIAHYATAQSTTIRGQAQGTTPANTATVTNTDANHNGIDVNCVAGCSGSGGSSITSWGGGVLGAMAAYGTSPGAVLVPGMNAFVTNVPHIVCDSGCGGAATFSDNSAFTVGATPVNILAGYYTSGAAPALTSGNAARLRMDVNSYLLVDCVTGCFQTTQPVSGTFWQATQPVSGTFWQTTQPVSIASMPSTPVTGTFWQATQPVSIASMPSTPVTGTFWQATQPVSIASMPTTPVTGTFFQATQPVSGTVTVTPPTLTKGTQGATGFSTQDLKDAGRTYVTFTLDAVAGVSSEALATMAINKAETASSATSYTVTSGKTLRIQSISAMVRATATTALTAARVRLRTAASAIAITSPLLATLDCTPPTAAALAGATGSAQMSFPDGIEVAATHQIALSQIVSSTSSAVTATVIGYEY